MIHFISLAALPTSCPHFSHFNHHHLQQASLTGSEKYIEQALLIAHHTWVILLCSNRPTFLSAFAFWFTAQVCRTWRRLADVRVE